MKVIFTGVHKDRPRFSFGDCAPPKWLRELAAKAVVEGNTIKVGSRVYAPGDEVKQ